MHHPLNALIGAPLLELLLINRVLSRRIYAIKGALTTLVGRERVRAAQS